MKKLVSFTIGIIALAMTTTITMTTITQIAEAELNCRNLEDGSVACSGGGSYGDVPGGGGGHSIEEPDGDTTLSGGGKGIPNNQDIVNGGRCELEPGGDDGECVGEYNRYD